mmetsp:Transcript_27294/g.59612  ORF Transcript_27294/g.59612 Transcript_27294/m.59612 type:complete len:240 (-) Transcript_27294:2-721(-)
MEAMASTTKLMRVATTHRRSILVIGRFLALRSAFSRRSSICSLAFCGSSPTCACRESPFEDFPPLDVPLDMERSCGSVLRVLRLNCAALPIELNDDAKKLSLRSGGWAWGASEVLEWLNWLSKGLSLCNRELLFCEAAESLSGFIFLNAACRASRFFRISSRMRWTSSCASFLDKLPNSEGLLVLDSSMVLAWLSAAESENDDMLAYACTLTTLTKNYCATSWYSSSLGVIIHTEAPTV